MSELYDNLLKATNNINDITTEKIGIITQLNGDLCNKCKNIEGMKNGTKDFRYS